MTGNLPIWIYWDVLWCWCPQSPSQSWGIWDLSPANTSPWIHLTSENGPQCCLPAESQGAELHIQHCHHQATFYLFIFSGANFIPQAFLHASLEKPASKPAHNLVAALCTWLNLAFVRSSASQLLLLLLLCIESMLLWLPLLLRHQWHIVGRDIPIQINVLNLRGGGYSLLFLCLGLLLQITGYLLLHQFGVSLLLGNICQNHCITNSDPWCQNLVANCGFALSELTCLWHDGTATSSWALQNWYYDGQDLVKGQCWSILFVVSCGMRVGVQTMARKATCEGITVYLNINGIICSWQNWLDYLIKTQEWHSAIYEAINSYKGVSVNRLTLGL